MRGALRLRPVISYGRWCSCCSNSKRTKSAWRLLDGLSAVARKKPNSRVEPTLEELLAEAARVRAEAIKLTERMHQLEARIQAVHQRADTTALTPHPSTTKRGAPIPSEPD